MGNFLYHFFSRRVEHSNKNSSSSGSSSSDIVIDFGDNYWHENRSRIERMKKRGVGEKVSYTRKTRKKKIGGKRKKS